MDKRSIYGLFVGLSLLFAASEAQHERKDWPSSLRYFGNEGDFAGLSVAMSSSYAAIGVPAGRIFGEPWAKRHQYNGDRHGHVVAWRRSQPDDWNWDPRHMANVSASQEGPAEFSDLFGTSLIINEPLGYLFVGAPRVSTPNSSIRGAVFAYKISASSAAPDAPPKLELVTRINISDLIPADMTFRNDSIDSFGFALASSGSFLVVSAPGMVSQTEPRLYTRVWIFKFNDSAPEKFQLFQTILHPENHHNWNSQFGFSLSMRELEDDRTVIAIGARYAPVTPANSSNELLPAGAVHIYHLNMTNSSDPSFFYHSQTLLGPHGHWRMALGSSLDLSTDASMLVVGAVEDGPNVPHAGKGKAFLYLWNETRGYERIREMHDIHGMKNDYFGFAVRFQHNSPSNRCRIAVGSLQTWRSEFNQGQSNGRGAVFVFSCDELDDDEETVLPLLWDVASTTAKNNGQFGSALAYDPTTLIVGAPSAPMYIRINIRNTTEIPDCGQMWVFDVKKQSSLPVWTIVLIAVTSALIFGFLVVSVVCLAKNRRDRLRHQYATLN